MKIIPVVALIAAVYLIIILFADLAIPAIIDWERFPK